MTDQNSLEKIYIFPLDAVKRAAVELLQNPTHEHVPGYLAIMRAQADGSGLPARSSDIAAVYDRYLRVEGAPEAQPYLRPFMSRGKGLKLSNRNVAGSYAVSNRRADGPFFQVVDVTGDRRNTEYRLNKDHADLAMTHLLQGNKLPITALAVFMYRDYGLRLVTPDIYSVVTLFRTEFGLSETVDGQKKAFNILFYDDSSAFSSADLIEFRTQSNG